MKTLAFAFFVLTSVASGQNGGLWVSDSELASIPASGPAWDRLVSDADRLRSAPTITLANQDDKGDSWALAAAMVYKKTGDESYRVAVEAALLGVIGTEDDDFPGENNTSLELSRNVCATVLAADLIGYREPAFVAWVDMIRTYEREDGRSIVSTHEERPNNWSGHAGASRIAASAYVRDWDDVVRAARVQLGWMGCRGLYTGFDYGELCWQADPQHPVGINPPRTWIAGVSVDGCLPDDQRRSGRCPPEVTQENYVYECLQGALTQAILLDRLGLEGVWLVREKALLRAYRWLLDVAHFPATGDDTWQPFVVRKVYPFLTESEMALPSLAGHGKSVGYTDFLVEAPSWP